MHSDLHCCLVLGSTLTPEYEKSMLYNTLDYCLVLSILVECSYVATEITVQPISPLIQMVIFEANFLPLQPFTTLLSVAWLLHFFLSASNVPFCIVVLLRAHSFLPFAPPLLLYSVNLLGIASTCTFSYSEDLW
jgi:hypothetical protein